MLGTELACPSLVMTKEPAVCDHLVPLCGRKSQFVSNYRVKGNVYSRTIIYGRKHGESSNSIVLGVSVLITG